MVIVNIDVINAVVDLFLVAFIANRLVVRVDAAGTGSWWVRTGWWRVTELA